MPPVPSSVSPALTDCCRACETCIVRPAPMYGSVSAIHVCVPRYECLPCPTTFQACLIVRPLMGIRAPQTPWGSGCAGRAPRHTAPHPYTKLSNADGTACCGRVGSRHFQSLEEQSSGFFVLYAFIAPHSPARAPVFLPCPNLTIVPVFQSIANCFFAACLPVRLQDCSSCLSSKPFAKGCSSPCSSLSVF